MTKNSLMNPLHACMKGASSPRPTLKAVPNRACMYATRTPPLYRGQAFQHRITYKGRADGTERLNDASEAQSTCCACVVNAGAISCGSSCYGAPPGMHAWLVQGVLMTLRTLACAHVLELADTIMVQPARVCHQRMDVGTI